MNSRQRRKAEAARHNAKLAAPKLERKRVHNSTLAMLVAFSLGGNIK